MRTISLFLLLLISFLAKSQDDIRKVNSTDNKEWILKSIATDQAHLWTSPLRMKKKDFLIVLPILTLTAASIVYDEQIYCNFKKFQKNNRWVGNVSPIVSYMGGKKALIGVSTLLLAGGVVFEKEKTKRTALMSYQTLIHTGIVVQIMKHISGRQRPNVENGTDKWNGPLVLFKDYSNSFSRYSSFPSGHTIMAWGFATVISEQYKEHHTWVPYICYTLASAAGLSRITEGSHWFSDVIIGSSMGYAIGRYITRKHRHTNWTLLPSFSSNKTTASLIYQF